MKSTKPSVHSKSSRLILLFMTFATLWSVLLVRAAWIQLIPNSRLESLKRRQFETTVTLGRRRGDILDRNGNELATSAVAWSLFVDPKMIDDSYRTAFRLAKALTGESVGRSRNKEQARVAKQILEKIKNRKRRFVWIARQLESPVKEAIAGLDLAGVGFIEEPRRIYPNQKLLANALGFVGQEGAGLEGLELRLNQSLSGEERQIAMRKDARGRPLLVNGQLFTEAPEGATVHLTIDRDLQFVVEQELAAAMRQHDAISATAIVLDAQTSEILAMSSLPTFDANEGGRVSAEHRRNRSITDLYEPGSTMKTFVLAGAVEEKKIEPNTKIFGEWGQMKIGKRIIREADAKHKFGWITVTEALAYSSNIGSTKIAQKLGAGELRSTYERFGFGEKSGIDLPGEVKGVLLPLPWGEHLLANVSFGHGISATPLQVANAYAAIANGGWLKRPYIVRAVQDPETGEIVETKTKTIRRALGDEAAAKMRLMLTAVTGEEGTGVNARVAGFPVAGKTGTAQRVLEGGRGYEAGAYVASFVGFLPANAPKFVIFVSLDKPQRNYYGSAVAAPVFARIARFAVRRAGLSPVLITAKNIVPKDAAEKARNPRAEASAWREERRRQDERIGRMRADQLSFFAGGFDSPRSVLASRGFEVGDFFKGMKGRSGDGGFANSEEGIAVPDVVGLSLREAMEEMARAGIVWRDIRSSGQGFVSRQSPESGARWSEARGPVELQLKLNQ